MSNVRFVQICLAAEKIARHAYAAYWDDEREDFHASEVREALADLATLHGATLTPIQSDTPEHEEAA